MHSRFALALVGVLALGSTACDQVQQPSGPVDLLRPASAVVQNDIIRDDVLSFNNSCTTPVQSGYVTGDLHTQSYVTTNGNHANIKTSLKFHGSGESTDGTKYQARINFTDHQTIDITDGFPEVVTQRVIGQLTSTGSGGNQVVEAWLHLTINANGQVTASTLDPLTTSCRG